MLKKSLLLLIGVILILVLSLMAAGDGKREAKSVELLPLEYTPARAACTMALNSGTADGYFSGWTADEIIVEFFDPANFCAAPLYPFEITALSFPLYDFAGAVWPATIDVVVLEADLSSITCPVPGAELCRFSAVCTQADFDGVVGTLAFPTPCCVNGPFFIGIEYNGTGPYPSILTDDQAPATCDIYDFWNGVWYEWYDVWNPPPPGYPMYWVEGETVSGNCGGCSWAPGDPFKMHYPQLPNETGWNVMATEPMVIADDWQCSETGWVKDVHFWGSWKDGLTGNISAFRLSIHEDFPVGHPQNPFNYSIPGPLLWEAVIADYSMTMFDPGTMEGWYNPATGEELWNNHTQYFQYDICLPEQQWFWQDAGTIYWLDISAIVDDPAAYQWGWKSTLDHWNDDAVWTDAAGIPWQEIWEPAEPLTNPFFIQINPSGGFLGGGGGGFYGTGWYFYEMEEWWNIWFYDHPFDPERRKIGRIEFDVFPIDPGLPQYFEIAVNWSTDLWLDETRPPLPGDDELLYIGRKSLLAFQGEIIPGHYILPYEIPEYNPIWVSVDVRGYNFNIPIGDIVHICQGSMDMAFVITGGGEELGACCMPDGSCVQTDANTCMQTGGIFQGVGSVCLGDGNGNLIDDACEGAYPTGACCYQNGTCVTTTNAACAASGGAYQGDGTSCLGDISPANGIDDACETGPFGACCFADGSCNVLSSIDCSNQGGQYMGDGTICLGDLNGNQIDDACEIPPPTGACCFTDGSCQVLTAINCGLQGGVYQGDGTICLGDSNPANGIDDACETPQGQKWLQPPDLTPMGMDVNATIPLILADDFLCTEPGPITEIHVWGSWLNDILPIDPGNVNFVLSIHTDIPANPPDQPFSMPGEIIWLGHYAAGSFMFGPYAEELAEGWFDPAQQLYLPLGDTRCWHYIFPVPEGELVQMGTPDNPVVYWLDVQALPQEGAMFGWKTSMLHWNDDAVWGLGNEPYLGPWSELRYPDMHPYHPQSIDLAFALYGQGICDCVPGEADGVPPINILDIVYVINYKFKGGPAPIPYDTCSADVDCNCVVNILDIVYLVNYKFKGGPAPCDCNTWVTNCGWPLRKK